MLFATDKGARRQSRFFILTGMAALMFLIQGYMALHVRKP
jgi:hypothetical protein